MRPGVWRLCCQIVNCGGNLSVCCLRIVVLLTVVRAPDHGIDDYKPDVYTLLAQLGCPSLAQGSSSKGARSP
jgi:hypothetical protein